MKTEKLDYAVYIGRFQPFHVGHHRTIVHALKQANHVIVVIGSHNAPRTIKNPFTASERQAIIRGSFAPEDNKRISFIYTEDRLYSDTAWVRNVEQQVKVTVNNPKATVGIVGHKKDRATAGYVNLFRQWKEIATPCFNVGDGQPLNATKIRELLFTGHLALTESVLPKSTFNWLKKFVVTPEFAALKHEYDDGIAYEVLYENAPFHSTNFYTADAVIVQSGHVLLIQRKKAPGKGLWALPGGHVNQNETAEDAALREADEETNIDVQKDVLRRCIFLEKVFDHPDRSLRARITKKHARSVTVAYGIKLEDKFDLPRVVAGDDAEKAWWFTFAEIAEMREQLFEDHADIIEYVLSRVEK